MRANMRPYWLTVTSTTAVWVTPPPDAVMVTIEFVALLPVAPHALMANPMVSIAARARRSLTRLCRKGQSSKATAMPPPSFDHVGSDRCEVCEGLPEREKLTAERAGAFPTVTV